MIARLRKALSQKDKGFTLIELLVVIVIIGLLAAIAIPVFLNQREKAYDAAVKSDLKTIAVIEETFFVDANTYEITAADLEAANATVSKGTSYTIDADADSYTITGLSKSGKVFVLDSDTGGVPTLDDSTALPTGASVTIDFTSGDTATIADGA